MLKSLEVKSHQKAAFLRFIKVKIIVNVNKSAAYFGGDNDYGGSDWGGDWGGCAGNILQMVACGHVVRSFTS